LPAAFAGAVIGIHLKSLAAAHLLQNLGRLSSASVKITVMG
jgi:hypothetical protein